MVFDLQIPCLLDIIGYRPARLGALRMQSKYILDCILRVAEKDRFSAVILLSLIPAKKKMYVNCYSILLLNATFIT